MPPTPPPHEWDYEKFPSHRRVLAEEGARIVEDIRTGKLDALTIWRDTRPIHERLFQQLTPKHHGYLAGHYRGESFPRLRRYEVNIPSNPFVGVPPYSVRLEMSKLDQVVGVAIPRLDAMHKRPDSEVGQPAKLDITIEAGCRLFAELLRIHPYANGNGHVARVALLALLHRYGYSPRHFNITPRPPDPPYSDAIRSYQQGVREPLETFVLACVNGSFTPPPKSKRRKRA